MKSNAGNIVVLASLRMSVFYGGDLRKDRRKDLPRLLAFGATSVHQQTGNSGRVGACGVTLIRHRSIKATLPLNYPAALVEGERPMNEVGGMLARMLENYEHKE